MSDKTSEILMVCARIDAPVTVTNSAVDKRCAECGFNVMIAPTGQAFLAGMQQVKILCLQCYMASYREDDEVGLTAPVEDISDEMKTAIPNNMAGPMRDRN